MTNPTRAPSTTNLLKHPFLFLQFLSHLRKASTVSLFFLLSEPALAHLNCSLPPLEHLLTTRLIHLRLKSSLARCVDFLELIERFPDTRGETRSNCSAESGGFPHFRPYDWDTDQIRLGLHAESGIAHTAVDFQFAQLVAAVFLHSIENGFSLETDGFEGCSRDVASFGVLCDTDCLELVLNRIYTEI